MTDAAADPRARVLEAADALFYARGVQAVGMDEVRGAAGVSLKRLYQEFPGKEQLVLAVLDARHAFWEEGVARAAARATTPRERLLSVFDFLEDWFAGDDFRGCGFINTFGEMGAQSPAVAEAARAHKASFRNYVEDLTVQAGGTRDLGAQIALLVEGAQVTAGFDGSRPTAGMARRAAATLLDAHTVAGSEPAPPGPGTGQAAVEAARA